MSSVQNLEVAEDEADQRLDRWFRRRFPHVGQGRIEKMCRKGEIRVNGGRVKAATRLEAGQAVRIPPLPGPIQDHRPTRAKPISDADRELLQSAVIYRDDHILALNKPPGLPVQGGSKQVRHLDGMSEVLRFGFDENPRLVHRLDKDTSGVLIMARNRRVAAALTEAFRHRDTRKIYWCVVAGVPSPQLGTIRYALLKAPGHGRQGEGEKMRCIDPRQAGEWPDAKRATTDYAVISALGRRAAWCALVPITGRTHQLRAHMAEIGHPIVGDGKYGGSSQENLGDGWGAQLGGEISRKLHLHARSLSLKHPVTGNTLELKAELPDHMARTWETLGWQVRDAPLDPFEDAV
jgi:23S rRNA pseudouridine955/2504/2580 synthase